MAKSFAAVGLPEPGPPADRTAPAPPAIAFGTPRDKQTNFVPARCAATEGNRQHSAARPFKPSVFYFPSRQTTPIGASELSPVGKRFQSRNITRLGNIIHYIRLYISAQSGYRLDVEKWRGDGARSSHCSEVILRVR